MSDNFVLPIRIYYEDTDSGGIVYHANYLKFADRARGEWLRGLGLDQHTMWTKMKQGFIIKRCTIDFKQPAILDDLIHVTCNVSDVKAARFNVTQRISRVDDDTVLAIINVCIVCVSAAKRPTRMHPSLHQALYDNQQSACTGENTKLS